MRYGRSVEHKGPTATVSTTEHGPIAVISLDDGKLNVIGQDTLHDINQALDDADGADAIVIAGRPGVFSAGFDLSVIRSEPEAAIALARAGAEVALRIYEYPAPTVVACTGHALGIGAILLLTFDRRVGTTGPAKIAMNEVAIGMVVPRFANTFAADRLARPHFHAAVALARMHSSITAVDAGFLDDLADDPLSAAIETAHELGATVDRRAFRGTRRVSRGDVAAKIRADLQVGL